MSKVKDELEIPKNKDYAIRSQTKEEIEKNKDEDALEFRVEIDSNEEFDARLIEQIKKEFEALKDERIALGLESKWKDRDAQYDGDLAPIRHLDFQIDVKESKIKGDAIVRSIMQAFFPDNGDIIDVTPRPETARNDGHIVAEKQAQFLDYEMDENVKPKRTFRKVARSAYKKYVGILKNVWNIDIQTRHREESYEGENVTEEVDGQTVFVDNPGLREFLNAYPDANERYPGKVKALLQGKTINIVSKYKEQVCNNPKAKYIPIEDFYVRNACDYNDGLKNEHLIGERQRLTYWDLKRLEQDEGWRNIDCIFNDSEGDATDPVKMKDYMTREYNIMEFTTFIRIDPDDDEETKIKCWFSEDKMELHYVCKYPYYSIDCDYIGFWLTDNDKGFYGDAEGVMYDLMDTHIAMDAMISLMLQGIYVRNIITPIVGEGSDLEETFLNHQFKTGNPIAVDAIDDVSKAVDFVNWPAQDINGALMGLEKMKRIGDDVSRVSGLVSGGESALDPSAPASKTMALLQQSGIGIKDYIDVFIPSFDQWAGDILQLYYQISPNERKFKIKSKSNQVTGENVFGSIKRSEMVVKTNVQSRAAAFVFDAVNEKREGLAAYQTINADPYASQIPMLRYKALKTFLETFGGKWKTLSDTDLPSPEEFKQQQEMIAIQAIQALMQKAQQLSQTTGVPQDPQEVLSRAPDAITGAQAVAYDPKLAEESK